MDERPSDRHPLLLPTRELVGQRNLLENAIQHSPDGGTVRLTADRDDGWARFVVQDCGPGFPPDLLVAAFDPFIRGTQEGAHRSGAGLGLAIVRAVTEAHSGTVSAQNTNGGARVTMASGPDARPLRRCASNETDRVTGA